MHTTTTCINTTFELAEAGLGSFHTPVRYFPSVVGGREREWALYSGLGWGWGSGLGDCLVLGWRFGSLGIAWVPLDLDPWLGPWSAGWGGAGLRQGGLSRH
ncbi:hypothetical protein AMECASPLE_029105 [Ameca splendens]|uniref:Uncharacterized protein n=1 Tax=Ameca splendens TaxID=208324 RepID=A0ABV0XUR4_9TELE